MKKFTILIPMIVCISCISFYISCDEGTTKKVTNITNNTTEIVADPEPEYVGTLSALDSNLIVSEVCYNSQVLYVFTKEVIVKNGKKGDPTAVPKTEVQTISTMYHLDALGRPIKCN